MIFSVHMHNFEEVTKHVQKIIAFEVSTFNICYTRSDSIFSIIYYINIQL